MITYFLLLINKTLQNHRIIALVDKGAVKSEAQLLGWLISADVCHEW